MALPRTLKNRVSDDSLTIVHRISERLQSRVYPLLTRLSGDELLLINNGYEEDPPLAVPLEPSDEPSRFCIQLYHQTATQVDLGGKRVLEVGSGHGGGASYLTRTLGPASYTGLDLNPAAVALCRKAHHVPGLDFMEGNSEDLPFPDESFDAVINIESSHTYPHFSRFLAEVARVLRPDGHFLYTDVRNSPDVAAWEAALAEAPLRMVSVRIINTEVARGLEKTWEHYWRKVVDRRTPAFLRPPVRTVVGALSLSNARKLQEGKMSYRIYCFAKS
jgi:ubiquinone/menaquinone biosynthesis C-methylase UbiE